MPSRATAPRSEALRVEAIFFRIRPQPAHRRLTVVNLCGPFRPLAETIADVRHRVARGDELLGGAGPVLAPLQPGTAVNPDNQRLRFVARGGEG